MGNIIHPEQDVCPFCDYVSGARPYSFVYRDSQVAILVTREQRGIAHVLVIPIRHTRNILDVSDDDARSLGVAIREAAAAINHVYSPKGISVWQNNGIPASQSIGHLHFHVAGCLESGGTLWGDVPELDLKQTEEIASNLKQYFVNRDSLG